jgi:hypothetical protein
VLGLLSCFSERKSAAVSLDISVEWGMLLYLRLQKPHVSDASQELEIDSMVRLIVVRSEGLLEDSWTSLRYDDEEERSARVGQEVVVCLDSDYDEFPIR